MKKIIVILFILVTSMLFLVSYEKKENYEKINDQKVEAFFNQVQEENINRIYKEENYIGVLEIPKLNLKRGFYAYESKENTVEKNIELISKNCYPNQDCPFILASHSGSSSIAFFKKLDQLTIEDKAIIHYLNESYEYKLTQIIHEPKTGTISILDTYKPQLILTTCNKKISTVQDIYIFIKT